ncbi:hypothetical protein ABXN37_11620 [Piscinibacter sakaiensis]|uniref:Uncharacterized protein n=1 Tax=Piscinibacter sakaiensis TaxID=1547922 RepID=A0A0K8NZJ3_PISS1|nr:hypothetical protein [Piscinibacter sakaiensis]GAP35798.1 hypothetical protein ISF6_1571 [Piscinibacter sakaiensis]
MSAAAFTLPPTQGLKPAVTAKAAWMKAQTATELLKHLNKSGNQVWLGATSWADGGLLLGWASLESAAAEMAGMARLVLPGDEGKAAVHFTLGAGGMALGVARPAHLASLAQRLFDHGLMAMPAPAQGRLPLVMPSLAQLLYQSVPAAVMYTSALPTPGILFTLGGGLQR